MAFNTVIRSVMVGVTLKNIDTTATEIASAMINVQITAGLDHLFFLDAPGGTGKTFLIKTIHAFLKVQGRKVIAIATSGVAASLLHHG